MNPVKIIKRVIDEVYNKVIFVIRKPRYKASPKIKGRIYMVGKPGAIEFGEGVRINSSLESNPIGGSTRTIIFAKDGASIHIGNNVGMSNCTLFSACKIEVGNDVLIGGNTQIYDTDFHSIKYEERMETPDTHVRTAPVKIEDGVFIGAHCIILKGVQIGAKSVVAAGSIVTKNIPSGELWGGVPAKFIKRM